MVKRIVFAATLVFGFGVSFHIGYKAPRPSQAGAKGETGPLMSVKAAKAYPDDDSCKCLDPWAGCCDDCWPCD